MRYENIENTIGLHKHLRVTYCVDCYSAEICNDNDETLVIADGETLEDALDNLEKKLWKP